MAGQFICPHCKATVPKPRESTLEKETREAGTIFISLGGGSADMTCPSCNKAISKFKIHSGDYDLPLGVLGIIAMLLFGALTGLFWGAIGHGLSHAFSNFDVFSLGMISTLGFAVPSYYVYAAGAGLALIALLHIIHRLKGAGAHDRPSGDEAKSDTRLRSPELPTTTGGNTMTLSQDLGDIAYQLWRGQTTEAEAAQRLSALGHARSEVDFMLAYALAISGRITIAQYEQRLLSLSCPRSLIDDAIIDANKVKTEMLRAGG